MGSGRAALSDARRARRRPAAFSHDADGRCWQFPTGCVPQGFQELCPDALECDDTQFATVEGCLTCEAVRRGLGEGLVALEATLDDTCSTAKDCRYVGLSRCNDACAAIANSSSGRNFDSKRSIAAVLLEVSPGYRLRRASRLPGDVHSSAGRRGQVLRVCSRRLCARGLPDRAGGRPLQQRSGRLLPRMSRRRSRSAARSDGAAQCPGQNAQAARRCTRVSSRASDDEPGDSSAKKSSLALE